MIERFDEEKWGAILRKAWLKRNIAFSLVLIVSRPHSLSGDVAPPRLTLAVGPTARATIVLPGSAGSPLQLAGQELKKYVEQMTGARLSLVDDAAAVPGPKVLLTSRESPNALARKVWKGPPGRPGGPMPL